MNKLIFLLIVFSFLVSLCIIIVFMPTDQTLHTSQVTVNQQSDLVNIDSNKNQETNRSASVLPDTNNTIVKPKITQDENTKNSRPLSDNSIRSYEITSNDPESKRINDRYEEGQYDPSYDFTWQSDMEYFAYGLIENKKELQHLYIDSYKCDETSCQLKLINHKNSIGHIANIHTLLNSLKDNPAIYKSGMNRNVYLQENSFIDGKTITTIVISSGQ